LNLQAIKSHQSVRCDWCGAAYDFDVCGGVGMSREEKEWLADHEGATPVDFRAMAHAASKIGSEIGPKRRAALNGLNPAIVAFVAWRMQYRAWSGR
jgi:hypothetical protein